MSFQEQQRVTVRLKCPNPLFEEWLTTWKKQAEAKESKMQYIYNHALQSLRKYPLPFESGRDCKILKGFGDKLCRMLDEKLKEYKKTNKVKDVTNNTLSQINIDTEKVPARNSTKPIEKDSKKTRSIKEYIPQYGSGGYAILLTLYKQSLEPNYPGYLHKTEIIHQGKDLINTSFTKPDPGSRYTAWSSMRTLLSKNLVSKSSHPPKFSLTQEGNMLARKLYENSGENEKQKNTDDRIDLSSKEVENTTPFSKCYDIDIPDEFTDELFQNPWTENDTFLRNVNNDIKYSSNGNSGGFDDNNLNSALSKYSTLISKNKENENYVDFLEPVHCLDYEETSGLTNTKIPSNRLLSNGSTSSKEHSCESEPLLLNVHDDYISQKFYSFNSMSSIKSGPDTKSENKGSTLKRLASSSSVTSTKSNKESTLKRFASSSSVTSIKSINDPTSENKGGTLKRFESSNSITSTKSTVVENFLMAPNTFDIILYVDNNETSGSSNSQNDEVLISLTKQHVKHEVKDLKVGDFLWICRDRITRKELVLPYIVERKRMDDFAHSIKDKRYHEQKFRLKRSGIENLIYLVESHGNNQHVGLPVQSLYQAASNTAIQENFFIKFTDNTRDTVEYLAHFSRTLVKMFKSKTLASCPKDDIQPVDLTDDLVSLITFRELNDSSVKNKRMKVTDLFVKMLIQIKGMSVERALAITQEYPTPSLLKRIYEENPGSKGEKLLSTIKYGNYRKSIGVVLSKIVYQAFTKTQY